MQEPKWRKATHRGTACYRVGVLDREVIPLLYCRQQASQLPSRPATLLKATPGMDFGDLELDDEVSPPYAVSTSRSPELAPDVRPAFAEAETATCDRSVNLYDDVAPVTACTPGSIRARIPGPAGQVQFQFENGKDGVCLVDPDFKSRPWLSATVHATGTVPIKSIGSSERIPVMVAILANICCSATGNAHILLKVLFYPFRIRLKCPLPLAGYPARLGIALFRSH